MVTKTWIQAVRKGMSILISGKAVVPNGRGKTLAFDLVSLSDQVCVCVCVCVCLCVACKMQPIMKLSNDY